jgi:hypothetical protein
MYCTVISTAVAAEMTVQYIYFLIVLLLIAVDAQYFEHVLL